MYRFIAAARGRCTNRPRTGSNPTVTFAIQFKKCWAAGRGPVAGLTKPGYRLTKPDVMPGHIFWHSNRRHAVLSGLQLFPGVREHARHALLAVPVDVQLQCLLAAPGGKLDAESGTGA
jgi:hypothetical protein